MTENKPHVVYPKDDIGGGVVFPNYKLAHDFWKAKHHYKTPYLIGVISRVIDPSAEIVDVNE